MLMASAKVYQHPSDWKNGHNAAYQAAKIRGIYGECTSHMTPKVNPYIDGWVIYKYEFSPSSAIYVGLTCKHDGTRWTQHTKAGAVHNYKEKHPDEIAHRFLLQTGIVDAKEAQDAEAKWLAYYASLGYIILNTAKAGSLGSVGHITNQQLHDDAKNYDSRTEWQLGHQHYYRAALKRNILDSCCAHMEDQRGKANIIHSDEDIIADAKKYKTLPEWREASPTLHNIAYKRGIQDQCKAHMSETKWKSKKWTDEALLAEAKKYKDKKEWRESSPSSMSIANARGKEFLAKCTAHMPKRTTTTSKWTDEVLMASARKYSNKTEWRKAERGAHAAAQKRGPEFFAKCVAHMGQQR